MSKSRILIATDLPFWRSTTGAEQRILVLVRRLIEHDFIVQTFFIGQTLPDDYPTVERLGLDVIYASSATPPNGTLARTGWWIRSVWNRFGKTVDSARQPISTTHTLADFRWPWAIASFESCVNSFRPQSIIFQYVKMAYLLEALDSNQRSQIQCVIDTHDVQHLRAAQFLDRGHDHWLSIDRASESAALQRFDLIVAIQSIEAETFRKIAPGVPTIVCGHEPILPKLRAPARQSCSKEMPLRVGYLSSANASNFTAIRDFIIDAWVPAFHRGQLGSLAMVIAGSVCQRLEADTGWQQAMEETPALADGIVLLGHVKSIEDFYSKIDIAINPVQFGAGLKIKNTEALGFGKPLVTTPAGASGMPPELLSVSKSFSTNTEIVEQLIAWSNDGESFAGACESIRKTIGNPSHPSGAYQQLFDALRQAGEP